MKTVKTKLNRFKGCLLGLAVGDALGTTNEFKQRGTFPLVEDIVGGGPFNLNPGEWTNDTSMALCLATSLIEVGEFDAKDQMERYLRWRDTGPSRQGRPQIASSYVSKGFHVRVLIMLLSN